MSQTNYKKYRRKLPYQIQLLILFGAALAVFLLCVLIIYLNGIRYITCHRLDGTTVKFLGRVDKVGVPISGTITYQDGSKAKIQYDTGLIEYSDGTIYEGSLSSMFERDGTGKLLLVNGESYEGEFKADQLTGYGVYKFINGDIYEGNLVNNVITGQGKYTYADGEVYEGNFKDGLRDGEGKMTRTDGSWYIGTYSMGIKQGNGTYRYSNGDIYEGNFENDMRHGEGKYTWANGETFTGSFRNNNIYGYGTYTWPENRSSYTGYFENGEIVIVNPVQ